MALFRIVIMLPLFFVTARAADIGYDTENVESVNGAMELHDSDLREIRALSRYGTALTATDRAKMLDYLLAALAEDPDAKLPLKIILKEFNQRKNLDRCFEDFFNLAKNNPRAVSLNLAALLLATGRKNIAQRTALAEKCVETCFNAQLEPAEKGVLVSIIRILGGFLAESKKFKAGNELFENLLDSKAFAKNEEVIKAAILFYAAAAKKASGDRRFLGLLQSRKAQYKERKDTLLKQLEGNPVFTDSSAKNISRALFYFRLDMKKQAQKLLLDALTLTPDERSYRITLARLYFEDKKYILAFRCWRKLIRNVKIHPNYYYNAGETAYLAKLYNYAAKNLHWYLLSSPPKRVSAEFMQAMAYYELNQLEKAIALLKKLPQTAFVSRLEAGILARQEKFPDALQVMLRAEKSKKKNRQPNKPDRFFYLFMMFLAEKCGKPELAEKYGNALLAKFKHKDHEILNAVGYTYAEMNMHLTEAETLIRAALKAQPDKGEYLDSLAWTLFRMKKYRQAEKYIQASLEQLGKYPHAVIADHAGDIYAALGEYPKALKYWRLALLVYSQDIDAAKIIKKINALKKSNSF